MKKSEPQAELTYCFHTPDGVWQWEILSSDGTEHWYPTIDIESGEVFCTCPRMERRLLADARKVGVLEPNVFMPYFQCRHIKMAIVVLRQVNMLPQSTKIEQPLVTEEI